MSKKGEGKNTSNGDQYYLCFIAPPGYRSGTPSTHLEEWINHSFPDHDIFVYFFENAGGNSDRGFIRVNSIEELNEVKDILSRMQYHGQSFQFFCSENYTETAIPSQEGRSIYLRSGQVARLEQRQTCEEFIQQQLRNARPELRTIHVRRRDGLFDEGQIRRKIGKLASCECNNMIEEVKLKDSRGTQGHALIRVCSEDNALNIVRQLNNRYKADRAPPAKIATKDPSGPGRHTREEMLARCPKARTQSSGGESSTPQHTTYLGATIVSSTEQARDVRPHAAEPAAQYSQEEDYESEVSEDDQDPADSEGESDGYTADVTRALEESRIEARNVTTGGESSSRAAGPSRAENRTAESSHHSSSGHTHRRSEKGKGPSRKDSKAHHHKDDKGKGKKK